MSNLIVILSWGTPIGMGVFFAGLGVFLIGCGYLKFKKHEIKNNNEKK